MYGESAQARGFKSVRTFCGQGEVNFSRFNADIFYGRPLIWKLYAQRSSGSRSCLLVKNLLTSVLSFVVISFCIEKCIRRRLVVKTRLYRARTRFINTKSQTKLDKKSKYAARKIELSIC